MEVFNVKEKLALIKEYWSPKIVGELNGQYVKLAKLKGEFIWHSHEHEDEMFMVLHGRLTIEFRDGNRELNEGDSLIIQRGVEHRPIAEEEVHILLFEPVATVNTGAAGGDLTKTDLDWI